MKQKFFRNFWKSPQNSEPAATQNSAKSNLFGRVFAVKTVVILACASFVFLLSLTFSPQQISAQTTHSTDVLVRIHSDQPTIAIFEPAQNFATKNDHFIMKIQAEGRGEITISDQFGTEIFRKTKTTADREILSVPVKFSGNPGKYVFAARIISDQQKSATAQIIVQYEKTAIPIIEQISESLGQKISAPNTGNYVKIFGKSFALQEIFLTFAIFFAFAFVIFLIKKIIKNFVKESAKN